MTRDEWRRARPVLTRALRLPPVGQRQAIESAFVEEAIRRELLEVLQRSSAMLPRIGPAPAAVGAGGGAAGASADCTPASPLLEAGQSLGDGRFVAIRQLGRGGMGEVYLAHDRTLGSLVALKVLFDADVREAQHARLCSGHAHIVTMHDVFEAVVDSRPLTVLVMEYVSGRPASGLLDDGPVDLRDAVRWARHVAAAMAHAHDRGVLHCDLKPGNVLITPENGAKVLDFGIGRATFERDNPAAPLRGTAAYMAPEQLLEHRFSPAGDIYSLGVTLYELVTGRLPFDGDTADVLLQIVGAEPPRASELRTTVPVALDRVLARALAKDPHDRYRSARALDRALEEVEQALATQTSPVPAPLIAAIPARGTGAMTYVTAVVAIVLMLTALGFVSSTALDSGLERTGPFRSETPLSWPIWGAMSLTAPLLLAAVGAILATVFSPLGTLARRMPGRAGAALRAGSARVSSVSTTTLAQGLLAANIAALVAFFWYYLPLLGALMSFTSGDPRDDISALSPHNAAMHNSYRQVMTALLVVFGYMWYRLVRRRRRLDEAEFSPALAGGAIAMGIALLLNVMPHRVIYLNTSEQVRYGGETCSLVGRDGDEALLFCPLGTARSRRVPLNDPALMRTGTIDNIFRPLDPRTPFM